MNIRSSKKATDIGISTATFVKAVLIILGLWFLWFIRDIVAIFLIALLLAVIVTPYTDWLAKHRVPRSIAVLFLYLVLGAILSIVVGLMIPIVIEKSIELVQSIGQSHNSLLGTMGEYLGFTADQSMQQNFLQTLQSMEQTLSSSAGSLFTTVKGVFGGIAGLFLVLVLAFYMVVQEEQAKKYFFNLTPPEYQPYLNNLLKKIQLKIGAWLRGQIILGLIVGTAVFIGLTIFGVKYALLLAIIAGLFEIIPYVGPIVSLVPAVIVGFAQSPVIGIVVLVLYLVIQQLENNILVPKIMQKVTGLNPLVSIAALLIGLKVGGLVGAILAIPVATLTVVVLEDLFNEMK